VQEELEDAGVRLDTLPYDLSPHLEKHPYDLSGGEQQLLALAKVLATGARLIIADEPTKGLDSTKKLALAQLFDMLRKEGRTVVIVTHDVEFAATCADRCSLFFRGRALSVQDSRNFFSGNSFYTTAVSRITRGIINRAMTVEDVVAALCKDGDKT
jgi:energy-coupling factor transport system ATP-binding protein